jgi:glutamate formiminotransferase
MRALELTGLIQATRYTMYIITSSVIVALPASVLLDVAAWAQVYDCVRLVSINQCDPRQPSG